MTVTSSGHWSGKTYNPEEREVAAVFLDEMRIQDPESPHFGYYDPDSQIRILVSAAMEQWSPPVPEAVAERAGALALMVRRDQLANPTRH